MFPENRSYDDDYTCSATGSGFACIDPSAACVDDDDITAEMVEGCGYVQGIGETFLFGVGQLTL